MCCHHKSVNSLDKQSGFSIALVAQYCSVAHERVKVLLCAFTSVKLLLCAFTFVKVLLCVFTSVKVLL